MRRVSLWVLGILLVLAGCSPAPIATDGDPMARGRQLHRQHCAVCHGASGEGGVGRALAGVLVTFPDCDEQVRWIGLGSERWRDEVGPTYGATDRVPEGAMPSFETALTDQEIRTVAAYERADFGGASEGVALAACSVAP